MADDKNLVQDDENLEKDDKESKKEKRKREKKAAKEKKKAEKGNSVDDEEEEEEKGSGKIVLFLVTLLIIAIWLGIIALLIKTDVGGFGSSVLYPVLKDVPYVNKILPKPESGVTAQHRFCSGDPAG